MADSSKPTFADLGTPIGTDFLGIVNSDAIDGDQHALSNPHIPQSSAEVVSDTRKNDQTNVQMATSWLNHFCVLSGVSVTEEMSNYVKAMSGMVILEERDVEWFVKGYAFCSSSRLLPSVKSSADDLAKEVRAVQRENTKMQDLIKTLEKKSKTVEKEMEAAVAVIRQDMMKALQSAVETVHPYHEVSPSIAQLSVKRVDKAKGPIASKPEATKPVRPVDPELMLGKIASVAEDHDALKSLREGKRNFMLITGVPQAVVDVLEDSEIDEMLDGNTYFEYKDQLADDAVRRIFLSDFNEAIEKIA